MQMKSDYLDRYFLPIFRWPALGICIMVALNFVSFRCHALFDQVFFAFIAKPNERGRN